MNEMTRVIDTSLMQKVHALLRGRRSVRYYRSELPPTDVLERILASAAMAPSAHNRQPWRYFVMTDDEIKARLADVMGVRLAADRRCDGDAEAAVRSDVIRSFQRITGAPVVIVVAMTLAEMDSYPDESRARAEYLMAVQSTAMATQNLLLAAHAYGPGSYAAHVAAARARGLTIETLKDWRLAFDVDGPAQYVTWRSWQEREHDGYSTEN